MIDWKSIKDQAIKEREEAFPVVSWDNAQEAYDFQSKRIRELTAIALKIDLTEIE
jgi:hypothetical protein